MGQTIKIPYKIQKARASFSNLKSLFVNEHILPAGSQVYNEVVQLSPIAIDSSWDNIINKIREQKKGKHLTCGCGWYCLLCNCLGVL